MEYTKNTPEIPDTIANVNLVLTCMDQLPDTITIKNGGLYVEVTKTQLYKMMNEYFHNVYCSEGPTRQTIKKLYTNNQRITDFHS